MQRFGTRAGGVWKLLPRSGGYSSAARFRPLAPRKADSYSVTGVRHPGGDEGEKAQCFGSCSLERCGCFRAWSSSSRYPVGWVALRQAREAGDHVAAGPSPGRAQSAAGKCGEQREGGRVAALPSSSEGGHEMRKFRDRNAGREGPAYVAYPPAEHSFEPSPDSRRRRARVNEYPESTGGDANVDREIAGVGGRIDARKVAPAYAQFGEHLSSVLQAANEAAKKVEEDARTEAERLRNRTQSQAASTLEDARRESEKLLVEAERLRTEAENESRQTRERAETYAAEKLRDAEAKAAGIVARAEEVAQSRAIAAEERSRELETNVELAERRLQQLATALIETASQLEGVVERPVAHAAGEKSASEPTGEGLLEETLVASIPRNEPNWIEDR
jgi:hypothetical protein